MKKLASISILLSALLGVSGHAFAGSASVDPSIIQQKSASPAFMIGIAVEFGDTVNKADVGLTAKVISSNRPNTAVIGGGLSFFPWSKDQVGLDIGVGYNFNNVGALAGYDFLRSKPQLSVGYVPTDDGRYCELAGYEIVGGNCIDTASPSDMRLKHDIRLIDVLDNGMKIYSFKYNWSDKTYVGVMAQDLLKDPRWSDAVITREDGYYAVEYDRINLRMTTLENWNDEGRISVARYVINSDRILN